jgi:phosphoribosylglycinamide formyltransferase 2
MRKKIVLLGSGELGKELVISLQRLGQYVIAVDNYAGAPAMQVAHESFVLDMLNGSELTDLINKLQPDIVVPEIEAIRTETFYSFEERGIQVVPSAKAANYTMNRKLIRDLAARDLGLRTASYRYASEIEEFKAAIKEIGIPCVVKPLMSSSGKGQSIIRSEQEIEKAWDYAQSGKRGDIAEVIVEEFIKFDSEITLLTVTQKNGAVKFCPAIGHRQERGDYQESWQPCNITEHQYHEACRMASKVTEALGGAGIWGVEFFLSGDTVYFSELSPRPHDTGMVTLAGTQNLNEFELHARAILGYPIPDIVLFRKGVSAVVLSDTEIHHYPQVEGVEDVLEEHGTDIRIFGKPTARKYRRMAVVLYSSENEDMTDMRAKATNYASRIKVM